ncbi:hypothetical protein [Thermogemmatispora carboxidivorans]|uniref:hypothetical protein n=1 Tax=Thermogemmatispora carboxidivorans TaxID=1382306 RepID=UPI000699F6AD|nr:hypothetical protein [Thermogemmatispora carboxidivorans]
MTHSAKIDLVEALSILLTTWVERAFPARSPYAACVCNLNSLWLDLAQALCGAQQEKYRAFKREIAQLTPTPQAGMPPLRALEQRLYELIDLGLRDFFLIASVRHALDQFIPLHFSQQPDGGAIIEQWQQLADQFLPHKLYCAFHPEELRPSKAVLSPESTDPV